jgi:hypothetical protein
MRVPAGLLLLCLAGSALAEQKRSHDFRGARFDPEQLRYVGPTPEKFCKLEAEGLRLRYTGADVPPTNTPSGVAWRLHVRGDFVATARYEILKNEPPAKGTFLAGAELYLRLDNPTHDAVIVARGVYPNGSAAFDFKVLTDDKVKRVTRDFKQQPATDKSLRGRLRLARTGPIVRASFAEGEKGPFIEFQRAEIGTADVQVVRFAGIAGGDRQAVLDLRVLELELEGGELALDGKFVTPPPKADDPKAKADVPQIAENFAQPTPGPERRLEPKPEPEARPEPASKRNYLTLAIGLALFVIAVLATVGVVLQSRRHKAVSEEPHFHQGE